MPLMSDGSTSRDYDLFVIGGGSGGLATAKRAASYGARVAIAEADRVGGTCVIRGCIPKKLMVYAADHGHAIADAVGYGWSAGRGRFDWPTLVRRRDEAVRSLEQLHEKHLVDAGVELLRGRARVIAADAIEIAGHSVGTRHVLVATGSTPVLPPIDGIEHAITSDGFFELTEQPARVAIVGGGYIAVEFASILRGLGSEVVLVIRRDLPLRGFDADLRRELLGALESLGVDVRTETTVRSISSAGGRTRLAVTGPAGDGEAP